MPEEIEAKRMSQDDRCDICKRSDRELVVDHCHKTKRFRALLCRPCNLMLGYAYENPEILARAISYLARWTEIEYGTGA
ncbi:MAG: hypothetical protein HY323_09245 [Betaproteobacteria bacterium]|nr:hypothetical protein [Betaproteobacteria bacterium]